MKRVIIIAMCLLAALSWQASAASSAKGWESYKDSYAEAKSVVKETEIEILTAPSLLIVDTSKQVKIQVFTILGRLVSSDTLPPGTHRLEIPAHGVYIVKVGTLTCKVAL